MQSVDHTAVLTSEMTLSSLITLALRQIYDAYSEVYSSDNSSVAVTKILKEAVVSAKGVIGKWKGVIGYHFLHFDLLNMIFLLAISLSSSLSFHHRS